MAGKTGNMQGKMAVCVCMHVHVCVCVEDGMKYGGKEGNMAGKRNMAGKSGAPWTRWSSA